MIIPPRLQRRPRDKRGYVIPYNQFIDANGEPDFRTIDGPRQKRALRLRLCAMCGEQMGKHIFFVGGPLCVEHGDFYDGPMHKECAIYALQTCPHLARSKGKYAEPGPRGPLGEGYKLVIGEIATEEKVEWFALMHGTKYDFGRTETGMLVIRAKLPWIEVERWRDGAPMEAEQAQTGR
jgi:hypothetical protein